MGRIKIKGALSAKLNNKQLTDAGMALTLVFLIIGILSGRELFYKISMAVLVINMVAPKIFYPFALFWYTLSNILGMIFPRILLTAVYFILVVPIGSVRRMMNKDALVLRKFKKGVGSVMKKREYTFTREDVINPY
jgi:hypothetical protein